jgi:hypothetical protein
MTNQEEAEDQIEKTMVDVIEQIKTIQGKTDMDKLKLRNIPEVLKMIGAYIHAIHEERRKPNGS